MINQELLINMVGGPEVAKRIILGEIDVLDAGAYDTLFEHYLPEMPYGTAKARDGCPIQWIGDQFSADLRDYGDFNSNLFAVP
jgi:hypothetical protein